MIIGAIFKAIFAVIIGVIKLVYGVLKALHLQWAFLVALIGGLLYITGVMQENNSLQIIMFIAFGLTLALSFILIIVADSKTKKAKKKKKEEKSKKRKKSEDTLGEVDLTKPHTEQVTTQQIVEPSQPVILPEKPKYFAVKQNPNYVMAEFSDRFELYKKTKAGLERVRTDYKENGN